MTSSSPKMVYAQSSDIRSRTYLEYRRDMKKKGIAELEFLAYLRQLLRERHSDRSLTLEKSGGDAELWFARAGGSISRAPDYQATLSNGQMLLYEFQLAENGNLPFFDFKVSKVGRKPRGQPRIPHEDREFFYIIKPDYKYAFVTCKWIVDNGNVASVPAWGSRPAYRVPAEKFLKQCVCGETDLEDVIRVVDDKNYLLEFQHDFLSLESTKLSRQLQRVVDDESLFRIVPRTLEGFYQVCYLLDKLGREPDAPGVWLVYLLTFFKNEMRSVDFAQFMYALDFLYFKCDDIKQNEKSVLNEAIQNASDYIRGHANRDDGSLGTDAKEAPLEETRRLLFATNLLEDIRQDAAVSFEMNLPKVENIFETIPDASLTANYVRDALQR